jgi:hypothetical protein
LALEFFENMNEPNACGCSDDLCMCLCCARAFLDAFKARRLSSAHFLKLVDDEMKVLTELPKLHEAAGVIQVFRKDSLFNPGLARELALALDVLVAPATSRWRRPSTCSTVAPQHGAKTPREKSSPNETQKH